MFYTFKDLTTGFVTTLIGNTLCAVVSLLPKGNENYSLSITHRDPDTTYVSKNVAYNLDGSVWRPVVL